MKRIQLSIPKPCHENWDAMKPEERGRFCGSCQKTVIDFSRMSDRELISFFNKPSSSMCGRFLPAQLDRVIEAPPKRIPWGRYFFTVALPAFLVSCKLAARQAVQVKMVSTEQSITGEPVALANTSTAGEVVPLLGDTAIVPVPPPLMGKVMYPPINSDRNVRKPKSLKKEAGKRFRVQAITAESNCFVRPPFSYQPPSISINEPEVNAAKVEDLTLYTVGGFSASSVYKTRTPNNNSGLSPIVVKKQVPAFFSLYPNPVQANGTFILDGKNLEAGIYQLAVVNAGGQVVQAQELLLQSKISKQTIQLKDINAGVYFVALSNKKGKVFSKKILVQ